MSKCCFLTCLLFSPVLVNINKPAISHGKGNLQINLLFSLKKVPGGPHRSLSAQADLFSKQLKLWFLLGTLVSIYRCAHKFGPFQRTSVNRVISDGPSPLESPPQSSDDIYWLKTKKQCGLFSLFAYFHNWLVYEVSQKLSPDMKPPHCCGCRPSD